MSLRALTKGRGEAISKEIAAVAKVATSRLNSANKLMCHKFGPHLTCNARLIAYSLLLFLLLTTSLEAASIKELEQKIEILEKENFRLRQELAMEEKASKLLGQNVLKACEEKVVLENEIKDKTEKFKTLGEELAGVRKLMEKEVASYRKELKLLSDKNYRDTYVQSLEKEIKILQGKLALASIPETAPPDKPAPHSEPLIKQSDEVIAIQHQQFGVGCEATKQSIIAAGKVLSVNKKSSFVILEFGEPDLIKTGSIFSVFRGGNIIGKVEVTRIRDRYVFARIIETAPGEEIKEGDVIQ